ncbi:FAD-binding and (Fe-S)-binding domain-containing protein [Amorphoplanes digitatis]|uniref:FAD/FMN-containing dehydrogenase/Fe-S oxidoreductase n=1 Tax=Actinoplanes digitatis TaxID=1868 RepID=A0A7W7MRL2_9ACTN|nr:FAD-binding and (Fe-S)-binding domain-containing protein [Actinoplanes digitatis]MBB4764376.1 FAD/FMN-containing dehydrogenase/Fe-S oxidoreductase [Actinoplanes digitatis]GID94137.1 lactate dehydrogenase [Actinoplanes digitatis]
MSGVVEALRKAGLEVRADAGTLGMYSSDASLYRIPPLAVVRPRHVDEVAAALAVARETGVPLTSRGAGTSVAGNAVGRGIVLDFSRHLNRVLDVDPAARTAVVEPGTVHAVLQKAVMPHGVRFGPDPSTHPRCTIGGMIGNNACGSRSLAYGRTSDNVAGLELLTAAGDRLVTGYDDRGAAFARGADSLVAGLRDVVGARLATARTEFDRFGRQVSGYAVQHLLPERFDLGRALVGSEGTLAVITQATVKLVVDAPVRVVVVLGFPDIIAAGEAAPAVVAHGPTSCEGLDSRLVDVLRARRGPDAVPPLPRGAAWLFVELAGEEHGEVAARARKLAADGIGEALVVEDPATQARLWRIREDGAGLAGRAPSDKPAWPGWEDAAVPPERLGAYLARFDDLVSSYGMTSAPFGHFGDGCMHVRLDYPLDRPGGTAVLREFLTDAAKLVGEFGGSLSGEHGDGRARSELLPHMYSADAIALFAGIKHAFDPGNLLNPGVLVEPDPVDADIRPAGRFPLQRLAMAYPHDDGDLGQAVHRCTGVGKCRADNSAAGGVMCPSYLATREEKDSTRGRARILQEVVRGELPWSHPSVHDAMDLCLSCKGCASDCPTGVDMATYKSEVLHQSYRGRLRPRSHYTLGRLPFWARLAGWTPRLANAAVRLPGLGRLALWLAGVDRRRSVPAFARRPFRRGFTPAAAQGRKPVVLFADSFSDAFSPEVAEATVRVLRAAGYEPRLPSGSVCCGLTWITTGQLDSARKILSRTVATLAADARDGVPIVGIEPSCTAVLRSDVHELLPGDADAALVAGSVHTLAELLAKTPDWTPPDLSGVDLVAQPHCHHHAVLGWKADADLLAAAGARVRRLAGCCGLAGNFGVELGHYEVSVAVAEQNLLPALDAAPDAVVLADGFSCRTQVADLRGRPAVHLAQLLDR